MATELPADLADDLELISCTICFEKFTSPKTLHCLHTFCEPCLKRHLAAYVSQRQDLLHPISIPCPTCREMTPLPDNGISGLRTDFKVAKITDLLLRVASRGSSETMITCNICQTVSRYEPATFHCKDCSKHFCDSCIYRHKNTELFDSHIVRELRTDKLSKNTCSDHEGELLRYFCQSCNCQVCTLCSMTEHMMHNLTGLDQGKAKHERSKKIQQLTNKVTVKVNQLTQFEQCLDKFEECLKTSYEETSQMIHSRADDIVGQIRKDETELMEKLQTQYQGKLENIITERESVASYKESLVTLRQQAESTMEQDNGEPFLEVSCELVRSLKQAIQLQFLNPEDFKEVQANFQLQFAPEVPKLGHLGDQNISANLSLLNRIPVHLVARMTGKLDWPSDVALTQDGHLVVADTDNYQLKLYNQQGELKQSLAVGELKPAGVVVTKVKTYAVTDILDRCVKIYSEQGQLLFEFGHDLFDWPAGICVNNYGEYIVSDVGSHCVTVHDSQGNILARLGSYGNGDNNFDCPYYVATNEDNDIIVSDMGNHCVKIYNYQLNLMTKIEDPENLVCPSGVAVDLQGNVVVCDSGSNSVLMYTIDGHLIDSILSEQDGIDAPQGLCITPSGEMAVTLCSNMTAKHEVRLYQLYD